MPRPNWMGIVQVAVTVGGIVWAAARLSAGQDSIIEVNRQQSEALADITRQLSAVATAIAKIDTKVDDDRRDIEALKARKQ